jgi:NAD(P)-dependent dehydrogenase (short-subunit alcohol dehydrogenase family)
MPQPVAIVTGASSGIGEATARRLADADYTVYAVARRLDRLQPLVSNGIRVAVADVTDDASLVSLVDAVMTETGRIDVLVNNAGYGSYGALEDVPMAEGRRQFEVNVFGLARLIQLVLPHMRQRRDGCIVNISSIGGKIWEPLGSWYHATKFAVEGLSDSLRIELAPFGIKVVIIEPGSIRTEWGDIAAEGLEAVSGGGPYRDQVKAVSRALRAADHSRVASGPEVVAAAVVRAVQSSRPRTRYPVGGGARLMVTAQAVLPDRGFDRFIRLVHRTVG